MKVNLIYLLSSIILAFLISCATNPVTGKPELMLLSKSDEIELGKKTDKQVVNSYGIYQNEELNNYISQIGMKMAKLSHRPDLPYEFKILDTPVINAFAVPGGFVYFTRGILAHLNSEAEVAGVMGHEIGHVTARHSAKQYSKAQLTQLGLGLGAILSEDFRQYAGFAQFGAQLLFLKFSRDNERQSDKLGVQYSTKAGYNATEMANFFETLDRMQPEDGGGLPGWLSTHPNPEDRVVKIRDMAQEWKRKVTAKNFEIRRDDYLNKINGLVFGNDPRQGYAENGVFYHPELTFKFPVPSKWKLNNTPSQVQIVNEDEDAVIIFSLGSESSPANAASKFLSDSKATVINQSTTSVNGLSAYQVNSEISTQDGMLRVLSYFIEKGNNIFVFHGFTAQSKFSTYQPVFHSTMTGFDELNDRNKINVSPDRIRIKKVNKSATLESTLLAMGAEKDNLEKLSLVNGMKLSEKVSPNMLIKTIVKP